MGRIRMNNRKSLVLLCAVLLCATIGCGDKKEAEVKVAEAKVAEATDSVDVIAVEPKEDVITVETVEEGTDAEHAVSDVTEATEEQPAADVTKTITEQQALDAIMKYCYSENPDLESIVEEGEYPVYWDASGSSESEMVIVFRSYTGAIVRYYIDRSTGDTYVTEFVPGITDDEERTDEVFNVKDYM